MEAKKLLFINTDKKTPTVSPITFMSERRYSAYDRDASDRELYIPISILEARVPELASELKIRALEQLIRP